MIDPVLRGALSNALNNYRRVIAQTTDQEKREDYLRLAAITEKVIAAMDAGDTAQLKLGVLGFSRQVSDSFSAQPPEFRELAEKIAEVKKLMV